MYIVKMHTFLSWENLKSIEQRPSFVVLSFNDIFKSLLSTVVYLHSTIGTTYFSQLLYSALELVSLYYTLHNIVTTHLLPLPPFFDFNLLFFPLFSTVLRFYGCTSIYLIVLIRLFKLFSFLRLAS